ASAGTLLEVRQLSVHFPLPGRAERVRAVDQVSLEVQAGETLALVGESGCGKSTLARAIAGLVAPTAGQVRFEGQELGVLGTRARRSYCRKLQMVFQDPDASLDPRRTIGAAVAEALELHRAAPRAAQLERVGELFESVGLDRALEGRYPHELSGGQKQRVCIARALAPEPRLLICDEAVSALDVSIQAQILNLLAELKGRFGLSYLFITHDLRVVRHIADRVAVMYLGELVELAPAQALFDAPQHPYTRALLAAVPHIGAGRGAAASVLSGEVPSPANPPSGCRFHPRCPSRMPRCANEAPPLYRLEGRSARCFLVEPDAANVPSA
ncbi:MAG TPA: ABC transporter ATP-binding protein, partial [Polyangiaceae bacterium]|nr:ABC transporter ATP-binding protein [Polyangiaceae bacterium]